MKGKKPNSGILEKIAAWGLFGAARAPTIEQEPMHKRVREEVREIGVHTAAEHKVRLEAGRCIQPIAVWAVARHMGVILAKGVCESARMWEKGRLRKRNRGFCGIRAGFWSWCYKCRSGSGVEPGNGL